MRKQKMAGVTLIVISAAIVLLAVTSRTPEERDATAAIITLPLGIYILVTKNAVMYARTVKRQALHGPHVKHTYRKLAFNSEHQKGATPWQENALQKHQQ